MTIAYRPEIDGMRAIAVLAVVIYHLEIPSSNHILLAGGGFGVDLFFVLSGFLISQILLFELDEEGRIDFGRFYSRRVRRILPALLMVMLVSIPVAWNVMLPGEFVRFGDSLFATLGMVSNLFWFLTLDRYDAPSGLLNPFLHSWSLAIEEQFYLFFPLLLLGLTRLGGRRAIWLGILVLSVFSFLIAVLNSLYNPGMSFFSPLSRAWELLAGAGLACLSQNHQHFFRFSRAAKFVPAIALLTLFGSFISFNPEACTHPGFCTLPVILATCALLWFTQRGEPVTKLLSTRPLVFIGKLSYSIYLWHYPIFAFGRLSTLDGISGLDKFSWVVATIVLSITGYYLVERPFRFRLTTRPFLFVIVSTVVIVVFFSAMTRYLHIVGISRLVHLDTIYSKNTYDNEILKQLSWTVLDSLNSSEKIEHWNAHRPSEHELKNDWYLHNESRKVLVLGDSHSKDLFNALHSNADLFRGIEFARFALSSVFPQEQYDALLRSPNFDRSDVVAIAPKYEEALLARLPALITNLQSLGKEVLLIGNTAEFKSPSHLPVFDWYLTKSEEGVSFPKLGSIAYDYENNDTKLINQLLRQMAEQLGVGYLSRRDLICNDHSKKCTLATPNGLKTMYDYGHWTLEGAHYFGSLAAEKGWFR